MSVMVSSVAQLPNAFNVWGDIESRPGTFGTALRDARIQVSSSLIGLLDEMLAGDGARIGIAAFARLMRAAGLAGQVDVVVVRRLIDRGSELPLSLLTPLCVALRQECRRGIVAATMVVVPGGQVPILIDVPAETDGGVVTIEDVSEHPPSLNGDALMCLKCLKRF